MYKSGMLLLSLNRRKIFYGKKVFSVLTPHLDCFEQFSIRMGKEHRCLKLSQFICHSNPDRYVYAENGSKNRSGGFTDMRIENKIVPIYANYSEAGDIGVTLDNLMCISVKFLTRHVSLTSSILGL